MLALYNIVSSSNDLDINLLWTTGTCFIGLSGGFGVTYYLFKFLDFAKIKLKNSEQTIDTLWRRLLKFKQKGLTCLFRFGW